jgi:periplasmic protein TonB
MRLLFFVFSILIAMFSGYANADDKSEQRSWETKSDYPAKALREGREGTVYFAVVIGTDGKVKSCTVTGSSGHADLDQAACNTFITRARFEPARDAGGNAIEGTFSSKIEYRIPRN